jgi:hypothetical protein
VFFTKSVNFGTNKLSCCADDDRFKLRCSVDREMDVKTSALVDDGVAECLNGMFCAFDFPKM